MGEICDKSLVPAQSNYWSITMMEENIWRQTKYKVLSTKYSIIGTFAIQTETK